MNKQYFKTQIDMGTTECFFYGVERNGDDPDPRNISIEIKSHKGSLDEFPTSLVYVGEMSGAVPLFKEGE